jgi:hypothetical protein
MHESLNHFNPSFEAIILKSIMFGGKVVFLVSNAIVGCVFEKVLKSLRYRWRVTESILLVKF